MEEISSRGGKREGAGRKQSFGEPTAVIRVPQSKVIEIKDYLSNSKKQPELSSISIIHPTTKLAIPLASEKVSAGFPSPAQDYVEKTLDLNEFLINNEVATFMAQVASESMKNAGIDIGDTIIVDRSIEPKHENIVVALVDNEFTVKRLIIDKHESWLKAENPAFPDIHFNDGQELIIWGVVTFIIKKAMN